MINKQLINQSKYDVKCPYSMTPRGICVHNTANDASAQNERDNVNRPDNNAEVSFHIAIDDIQAIQLIPFDRNTWHAGDGGNGRGNRNHISVEICYSKSGGERFAKAEQRAAKVIAKLLKDYGWGIDKVKKHQDFSNKYCPHRTLDMGWNRFINMIKSELNGASTPTPPATSDLYRVRKSWGDAASQKGAYSSLENAKNECNKYAGYGVYDNKGIKVYPTNAPTPPPAPSNKKYLNLKPHMQSWKIYNQSGPYTTNKAIASLAPAKFGGLSYEILGSPQTDVHLIQTEQFGKVAIYAPRDNDSSITTSKLY